MALLALGALLLLCPRLSRGTLIAQGVERSTPSSPPTAPSVQPDGASGRIADPPAPPDVAAGAPFSFVVLGHLRGDLSGPNFKLAEVIDGVRQVRPTFVVLVGDIIWGDTEKPIAGYASVRRQWDYIDSAFATVGVPVYRVPGNHDINDIPTRDVYRERYGILPQSIEVGDSRLLLLSSAWVPADGDTRKNAVIRATDLDSTHTAWLASELPREGYAHTFVFMHHLLWWQDDDASWWSRLHPLLARAKVDAVFSGDYGPMKFSHTTRDGVRYFQTSIEDSVSKEIQRGMLSSRLLSAQFDNFLEVRVNGRDVDVKVHTVAETSTPQFTPERYKFVNAPPPPPPLAEWLVKVVGRKRLAMVAAMLVLCFVAGVLVGRRGAAAR